LIGATKKPVTEQILLANFLIRLHFTCFDQGEIQAADSRCGVLMR